MRPRPAPAEAARFGRDRGFALLIVLWSLALLAMLGTQVTALGRGETLLASNLRAGARAEAAADGAFHEALFHVLDSSPRRWLADGVPRSLPISGGIARIRVANEQAKVNPNSASAALLQSLMVVVGAEPAQAAAIAAAMLAWRAGSLVAGQGAAGEAQYRAAGRAYGPPATPFESLDELGLVLGMTPDLLARLRPELSLYAGGTPDRTYASATVLRALAEPTAVGDIGDEPSELDAAGVVSISVAVDLAEGARFVRQGVVRLGGGPGGRPWLVLDWTAPEP